MNLKLIRASVRVCGREFDCFNSLLLCSAENADMCFVPVV